MASEKGVSMLQALLQFADSSAGDAAAGLTVAGFGIFFSLLWLAFFGLIITSIVFWILSLVHVLQHQDIKDRVMWIVVLLVVGNISGFIYYIVVKRPYDQGGMREPTVHQK